MKALAELLGEDVSDLFVPFVPRSRAVERRQHVEHVALGKARSAFEAWCREKLRALADKYQDLCEELEVLKIAYRQTVLRSELYTQPERSYWAHRFAYVHDTLPSLENDLDILTYREHEEARMAWWLEETKHEQA